VVRRALRSRGLGLGDGAAIGAGSTARGRWWVRRRMRGGMVVVVKAFVEFGCRGRGLGGGSEEGLDKELSFGNMQAFWEAKKCTVSFE